MSERLARAANPVAGTAGQAPRAAGPVSHTAEDDRYFVASQWQLMWRKFTRHKLAIAGGAVLAVFYVFAAFSEFFATHDILKHSSEYVFMRPQKVRFGDENGWGLRPFVYDVQKVVDRKAFRRVYVEDHQTRHYVRFFVHGDPYKLWGIWEADLRLAGVEEGAFYLFGTDKLGRDLYSRTVYASRISLSIGLIGVFLSFVLGCTMGGISGYYGGKPDMIIQRGIEILISLPTIPLWMALSAALPTNWGTLKTYFAITVILSMFGWAGLARVVRGKLLELREQDFVTAARVAGRGEGKIVALHLLPSFMSYLIVSLTLAVPYMILGETALSFLGLGLRPPVVSWGTLLKDAQNVHAVLLHPWLLIPGIFVVVAVLAFNFLGDGLRDAADPYK